MSDIETDARQYIERTLHTTPTQTPRHTFFSIQYPKTGLEHTPFHLQYHCFPPSTISTSTGLSVDGGDIVWRIMIRRGGAVDNLHRCLWTRSSIGGIEKAVVDKTLECEICLLSNMPRWFPTREKPVTSPFISLSAVLSLPTYQSIHWPARVLRSHEARPRPS